jgi:hypothetical protein
MHFEECHQFVKTLLLVKASCLYRLVSKFRPQSKSGIIHSFQIWLSSWQQIQQGAKFAMLNNTI